MNPAAAPVQEISPPPATASEVAVIYVSAASVSLLIGNRGVDEPLEHLDRPLPLARDIFRGGSISRPTMEQAAMIMRDYLQAIREFGLPAANVRLYTTNILAEASNNEIFLNRLQVTTGLAARLIDDGDMTRLIYQIALRLLKRNPKLAEGNTFVSHIGPGNTRALYFKKGRIAGYSNYRLGIFRAREAVAASEEGGQSPQQLAHLEEQIRGVVDHLAQDYSGYDIGYHVAIGNEIQSVAPLMQTPKQGASRISEEELERFTGKIATLTPDQLVRKLSVHYTGGEGVVPALQANLALAKRFGDEFIWVPEGDFQRDLLRDLASEGALPQTFQDEVMQTAGEIGTRYKTDRRHAEHVAAFARQIFRELRHLHGLDSKYELLLRVAANLHEVGMFVSPREHHKHSLYIIMHTEVFGLSTADRTLVALLARYHRRYNPEPSHPHFSDLTREERMVVFKLAAILRIADALDRSHSQRIRTIQLRPEGNRLYILTPGVDDTTVEQIAINSKCDIFREIYGYDIVLSKP
ncbi:MAG: HD domain-containing protein [Verrucomicrobiaceae bacterium]|nr:HD domain-containing protein [Verrucomicrobiaceae bacterium]